MPLLLLKFFAVIGVIICLIILAFDAFYLLSTIGGAIYFPTSRKKVLQMIKLAKMKKGEKAVDIGSGDGRIVIELARAGAIAHGYEINIFLVWYSRWQIFKAGLHGKAFVHWKSFWHVNFSDFQVVTLFGISYIMKDLEKKLQKELRPGARVVANAFPFPNWKESQKEDEVYVYLK